MAQLLPGWSSPPAMGIPKQDVERWHSHAHWRMSSLPQEPMDECPPKDPVKKQVRFCIDEDLGDDPTLPTDLTNFLEGDSAEEWHNTQSPPFPWPWIPHSHLAMMATSTIPHTGGAHPKAPVRPSAPAWSQSKSWLKGMPDTVNHPNQWIKAEMDRVGNHPHWWKEIRDLKRYTLESALKRYTIDRNLSEPEALYFSWWQAVALRLPLAQQEASGQWDSPPCFHGLHLQDFLSHVDASRMRNFCTIMHKNPSPSKTTSMLCREVRGSNWVPLWCGARAPEVHSPFDMSKQGQDSGSFTSGVNWATDPEPPPPWRRKPPSWGGTGAVGGSRIYPSRNIQKLLSLRNLPSKLMLWVPLLLQIPTMTCPGKQRDPSKGLSPKAHNPWPWYHQWLGPGLPQEEQGDTWLLVGIPVHLLPGCWAPQWHPCPRPS